MNRQHQGSPRGVPRRLLPVGVAALLAGIGLVPTAASAEAAARCMREAVTIMGTEGPDVIVGTPGRDVIDGLGGDDQISGDLESDVVCGNSGNDTIMSPGDLRASGGPGNDHIEVLGGEDFAISRIYGGPGDDELVAGPALINTDLFGGPGDDVLRGGNGPDSLAPGLGRDVVEGGGGGGPQCGSCTDELRLIVSGAGPVTVDLTAGFAKGQGRDSVTDVEDTYGTHYADRLIGSEADNTLGGWGEDHIEGLGGDDTLYGYGTLLGGPGNDSLQHSCCEPPSDGVLDGGDGYDELYYDLYGADVIGPIRLNLTAGTSSGPLTGNDVVSGIEEAHGTPQDDTFIGDANDNLFDGRGGDDRLLGMDGDDDLSGAAGRDEIDGGAGDDTCRGEVLVGCES